MKVSASCRFGHPYGLGVLLDDRGEGWGLVRLDVPRIWCGWEFREVVCRFEEIV